MSGKLPPDDCWILQASYDEPPEIVSEVVAFPKRYRHPLPPDAIPNGRERHVDVFPMSGGWVLMETDDGGGYLSNVMSKREAIAEALDWVTNCNCTMSIHNEPMMGEDR